MPKFLKVGDTAINLDRATSVELQKRVAHPDKARHAAAPFKAGHYPAVRIRIAGQEAPIDLFDEEAEAAREYFAGESDDITPKEKDPKDAEADRIQAEADAAGGGAQSGILDAERLAAATSAGQDRVGAADLRPPAARTTPPPGTAPATEPIVPARTAGLHETPVEAKGVVATAETVRADDERRAKEGAERTADLPKYPSDISGEADPDEPGKLKTGDKGEKKEAGKTDKPESRHVDTGAGPPQNLKSMSDAPVVGRPKDDHGHGHGKGKR